MASVASRYWPALIVRSDSVQASRDDLVAALLDEFSPIAIEDLAAVPLPPGGLWDPTFPPLPEPPPAPLNWRVFFNTPSDRDAARQALESAYPELRIEHHDVADEDWAARSQQTLHSITAGGFIVAPPWDIPAERATGSTLIVIEPSRGFGTGHHASTRLCLRAMSEVSCEGVRVLDLGTGSGVLAMAAALRGARQVMAVDVDPDAIESAGQSAAMNAGVERIQWLIEDFRDAGSAVRRSQPFDVVLANLTGGMLTLSADILRSLIREGGHLIASGFDENERDGVEAALNLRVETTLVEQGWVGLVCSRRPPRG